jgi:hypothetical protein
MARQPVVQLQCDRCKRVSLVPLAPEKALPDFEAQFKGQRLVYQDLCEPCSKTLQNVWQDMAEWERTLKQALLSGPQVGDNQAAPLDVAPSYTPPKPHSAAGAKKS